MVWTLHMVHMPGHESTVSASCAVLLLMALIVPLVSWPQVSGSIVCLSSKIMTSARPVYSLSMLYCHV